MHYCIFYTYTVDIEITEEGIVNLIIRNTSYAYEELEREGFVEAVPENRQRFAGFWA